MIRAERAPSLASALERVPDKSAVGPKTGSPSFADVLAKVGKAFDRSESKMDAVGAAAAHTRSPTEILMLQAETYRYTEMVTVASKVVESTTSGIKTILGKAE